MLGSAVGISVFLFRLRTELCQRISSFYEKTFDLEKERHSEGPFPASGLANDRGYSVQLSSLYVTLHLKKSFLRSIRQVVGSRIEDFSRGIKPDEIEISYDYRFAVGSEYTHGFGRHCDFSL